MPTPRPALGRLPHCSPTTVTLQRSTTSPRTSSWGCHAHGSRTLAPLTPSFCTQRQQQPAAAVPFFSSPRAPRPTPPSSRWTETTGERGAPTRVRLRVLCSLLHRSTVVATATDTTQPQPHQPQPAAPRSRPVPRPSPPLRHGCPSRHITHECSGSRGEHLHIGAVRRKQAAGESTRRGAHERRVQWADRSGQSAHWSCRHGQPAHPCTCFMLRCFGHLCVQCV
jgi:hypothetical protein